MASTDEDLALYVIFTCVLGKTSFFEDGLLYPRYRGLKFPFKSNIFLSIQFCMLVTFAFTRDVCFLRIWSRHVQQAYLRCIYSHVTIAYSINCFDLQISDLKKVYEIGRFLTALKGN